MSEVWSQYVFLKLIKLFPLIIFARVRNRIRNFGDPDRVFHMGFVGGETDVREQQTYSLKSNRTIAP